MSIQPIGASEVDAAKYVEAATTQRQDLRKAAMEAAAQILGMSVSDLQTALKSGQTMQSLAKAKGIDEGTLAKAVGEALTKANPALSAGRAQLIALRMIDGAGSDRDGDGDGR